MNENVARAERALEQLGLAILSDDEIAEWNDTRNHGSAPMPEVRLQDWRDEGAGLLSKEFYVRDPSGVDLGHYRKAWFGEWEGRDQPGIVLEDHEGKEIPFCERF